MHLDALQARRTQAGAPVVHGINLLLWALDSLRAAKPELPHLRSLRAQFNKFVYLDELVDVEMVQQRENSVRLVISVDGAPRSKVSLNLGDANPDPGPVPDSSLESIPICASPMHLSFEEMSGRSGRFPIQMTKEDAAMLYPAATQWLGASRVAALGASTYLVGMVCPGMYSIYGELEVNLRAEPGPPNSLEFRVTETDGRFRSVDQEIAGGGLAGTVKCFARTPPVQQATMQSLAGLVGPEEFAGSVALIAGGSRGLGELVAKLIASGGGHVLITWQSGKEDAERVVQEIRSVGGTSDELPFDARKPASEQIAHLKDAPTHLYYFATPSIFKPQAEIYTVGRLNEFLAIYVEGFWNLSRALCVRQPALSIFYPSSIFVSERPRGMTEYTMAKAAGEVLCADMNESLAPMHVTVSRLPRLLTDQTASITATETADPVELLLPLIREVQSRPR